MELIDGTGIWDPSLASGLPSLKLWFAAWLQGASQLSAAATGSAVTAYSNKVFLCFRLLLAPEVRGGNLTSHREQHASSRPSAGGGLADVEGCLLFVFNINGFMTHLVVWRNGLPVENTKKFIGGRGGAAVAAAAAAEGGRESDEVEGRGSHSSSASAQQQHPVAPAGSSNKQPSAAEGEGGEAADARPLPWCVLALQRWLRRLHVSGPSRFGGFRAPR